MHMPNFKELLVNFRFCATSDGISKLSRGNDQGSPVCSFGKIKDSHVKRVTFHPGATSLCSLQKLLPAVSGARGCEVL